MTIHPDDQPVLPPAAAARSGSLSLRPAIASMSRVVTVAAQDLHLLPAGTAVDLTGVAYALPVPRGYGADDHHWQRAAPRREDGWTCLHEIDLGQSRDDPATRRLRQTLSQEYLMLRVGDPAPHETGQRQDRVIGVHRCELLTAQTRTQAAPAHPAELIGGACGVEAVLADAAGWRMRVVLALTDGTRLNGVPDLGPPGSGTVQVREETGQEPFTIRLTSVIYVRPVTARTGAL